MLLVAPSAKTFEEAVCQSSKVGSVGVLAVIGVEKAIDE